MSAQSDEGTGLSGLYDLVLLTIVAPKGGGGCVVGGVLVFLVVYGKLTKSLGLLQL